MIARTPLLDQAETLAAAARARVPGRLADLVDTRIRDVVVGTRTTPPPDLTDDERVVLDLAEQFAIDAHGIEDDHVDRLRRLHSDEEVVALMFHFALCDGLAKLSAVHGPTEAEDAP